MPMTMFRRAISLLLFLSCILVAHANNLRLGTSVRIVKVSDTEATIEVSLSWERSWRDHYNNDAAWLFFKYRTASSDWETVILPDAADAGSSFIALPGKSSGDPVGYFVYRSVPGSGNVSTTFRFKWSYPSNLNRTMFESNQVFLLAQGIEMVYIPYGAYTLGDGSSRFSFSNGSGNGIDITNNEDREITASDGSSFPLYYPYPTGYEGFYVMKYELSQEQYVAFINALPREAQLELLPQLATLAKGDYLFGDPRKPSFRNGIVVSVPLTDNKGAVLDNNLSGDSSFGGEDDGRTLACNYLSPLDLLGYMSWSGLRPMTEIEYEKACRRLLPYTTIPNAYAWGTTSLISMTGIVSETSGYPDETPNDGWVNAEGRFGVYPGKGPVRCGAFSTIASNHESAGSTYLGVMEMSGNLGELCLNISAQDFDGGIHGNGSYTLFEWNEQPSSAFGLRGGSFASPLPRLCVSDRSEAESNYFSSVAERDSTVGFRGVRMLDRTEADFFIPGTILCNGKQELVVCSGIPFTVSNATDGGSRILSGLQVTYKWFVNGREIAGETGSALTYPSGMYNTSMTDSIYRFTRRVFCALGELETEAVVVTVPGKMELDVSSANLACNVTSAVTASRLSNTRFRWVNASSGKVVRDWSSPALTDSYSSLHSDFIYRGGIRKLRCISDVDGCRDSMEISLTVEPSCFLTVDSTRLHMSTNVNGGTAVASLCGPGTVKWYYKDNGGDEHLISTATTVAIPNGGIPLFYTTPYKPQYKDFKNTIGERTVVVHSSLGDDSRCIDTQELTVDVKAALDPGKIGVVALACEGSRITVNNDKDAGVEGMDGLSPVYSWFVNGSATPLAGESSATLSYTLPANTSHSAVTHTFVRRAMTVAPSLQTKEDAVASVIVPGIPEVSITAPAPACDNTNLPLIPPTINWAGLEGQGAWSLNGAAVPSPVKYAHNGQALVYAITNTCHTEKSNTVNVTVNAKPVVGTITAPAAFCHNMALPFPAVPAITWNGAVGYGGWVLEEGEVPNPVLYQHTNQTLQYKASNVCGYALSDGVRITVDPPTLISGHPVAQSLCQGNTITLSVGATGLNLSYQWQKDGGNIGGATAPSYSKPAAVTGESGTYRCVVRGTCGEAISNGAAVTVYDLPSGSIGGGGSVCPGGTATINLSFGGGVAPYYYTITGSGEVSSGGTSASASRGAGTYYLTGLRDGRGCYASSLSGSAIVSTITPTVSSAGSIYASATNVCTGASFSVNNNSSASSTCGYSISYEWFRNGSSVASGISLGSQTLSNGTYSFYRRACVNGYCANSNTVSVTVAECCPAGMISGGGRCWTTYNVCTACTWDQAFTACSNAGMRLPSYSDWASLPAGLNVINIPDSHYYWSSTAYNSSSAYVGGWNGNWYSSVTYTKTEAIRVRCVK